MSETTEGANTTDAATATEATGWKAPESQAELDQLIAKRLSAQRAQFADYDSVKAKAAKLDEIEAANKTELEKAQGELTKWQSEAETWRGAAVASTVRALAATEFADPDDAVRNLDVAKYLDAGGVINEDGIKTDLAALLESKPHYRRPEGATTTRVPAPNRAQGASNGSPSTSDPATQFASILQGHLK